MSKILARVVIPPEVLGDHVGVKPGTPEYDELTETVRAALALYSDLKAVDVSASAQINHLAELRKALDALVEAETSLDRMTRSMLKCGPLTPEALLLIRDRPSDFRLPKGLQYNPVSPAPDVNVFAEQFGVRIADVMSTLESTFHGRQRPTELARDIAASMLSDVFSKYYDLAPEEFAFNLDAFLRGLFKENHIHYPEDDQDYRLRKAFLRKLNLPTTLPPKD